MLCQFEKLLYPRDAHAASAGSYMVAVYRPCEILRDSAGDILPSFKAVGYYLPVSDKLRYDFRGRWSRNAKHGTQFEVDSYDEVIIPSREGIIGYLSSGQIKGIGPGEAAGHPRYQRDSTQEDQRLVSGQPGRARRGRLPHALRDHRQSRGETLQGIRKRSHGHCEKPSLPAL